MRCNGILSCPLRVGIIFTHRATCRYLVNKSRKIVWTMCFLSLSLFLVRKLRAVWFTVFYTSLFSLHSSGPLATVMEHQSIAIEYNYIRNLNKYMAVSTVVNY